MHCRMPGLCLALSCINACINLSPANLSILRIETHFRFGCYRTPDIADQAARNSEFSGFRWGHGRWACCRAFFTKSQRMCKRSFAKVAELQGLARTIARCAVRGGRSAGIGRYGRPLCHDPGHLARDLRHAFSRFRAEIRAHDGFMRRVRASSDARHRPSCSDPTPSRSRP